VPTIANRRQFLAFAVASALAGRPAGAAAPEAADRVRVRKAERRLFLERKGETIRSYPIRLGRHPLGPKIFEWDGRTPEGRYTIDGRTLNTPYHRALHVSYPNAENRERARQYGIPPGGGIWIHGTPAETTRFQRDWTDGCIAASNAAIEEIWMLVADGTPIEIEP